jgi:hypothetical protein
MTDAIEFHEREAKIFKDKYLDKKSFRFRLRLWGKIIRSLDSPVVRSMDLGCGPGWMTKILCEVSTLFRRLCFEKMALRAVEGRS